MHVSLRRSEFLMTGEFLNRLPRSTSHSEMATERVPQDVNTCRDLCAACRVAHTGPRTLSGDWFTGPLAHHTRTAKMTVLPECGCNTLGHRHDPNPPVLRRCQLAAPIRVTDIDLLPLVVDVSPLQRDDLANPKPTLAP